MSEKFNKTMKFSVVYGVLVAVLIDILEMKKLNVQADLDGHYTVISIKKRLYR